jgi:transposase
MRKLHIEDAHVARIAIQHEITRTEESRYGHRLHGLLLLAAGHSCRQVAALFGEDDTTVQRWVRRFTQGGLTALREGQRSGRPPALDPEQWSRLEMDLRRSPLDFGLAADTWDGPTLCKLLQLRYGVELGVRQCQRIVRRIRFGQHRTGCQVIASAPLHDGEMTASTRIGTAA